MAGGEGSRMELLTDVRAKPALPYAGVYRLIDFPLSNCVHSGLSDIWIMEQFLPHSLNDHLANGRPWDLDRTYGGLRLIQPHTGTEQSGWHQGNADAIYRNIRFIRQWNPDIVVVLSADHIYKLDYSRVIDEHRARSAAVTMVITEVPVEQASRFGTVQVDGEGRVTEFEYKPERPKSGLVTTEVFVYSAAVLLDTLEELAGHGDGKEDNGEPRLKDFGHELLPRLVREGRAYAYCLQGYWMDVGTIESYWQSHMDLLQPERPLDLDEPGWPIFTFGAQRMPAHIEASARIENSLVSPGCRIGGKVVRSVLAPGVVVEEGAEVHDSIVLHDSVISAGASVRYTIVDGHAHIGANASVGASVKRGEPHPELTLVGQAGQVPAGERIPPGGRIRPGMSEEAFAVEAGDSASK